MTTTIKHNGYISYKSIKNKKVPYELNINYFDAINNPNKKISAIYQKLYSHYEEILKLDKELN